MIKRFIEWLKSLFFGKSDGAVEEEAPTIITVDIPNHFHVDRANSSGDPLGVTTTLTTHEVIGDTAEPAFDMPNFNTMSKMDLDIWARTNLGLRLDKRRSKIVLINTIKEHLNKEN